MNSTMSVGQARKLVEQLKIEASFCRIKVKHTAARLTFRRDKGVSRHHNEQINGGKRKVVRLECAKTSIEVIQSS